MSKWTKKNKSPSLKPYIRSMSVDEAAWAKGTRENYSADEPTSADELADDDDSDGLAEPAWKIAAAVARRAQGAPTEPEANHPPEYPFNIPAVAKLGCLEFAPDVTFFIGENGAGKSTLLEAAALAFGFPQEGGSFNHMYEGTDTVSALHQNITLKKGLGKPLDGFFLRAESFYNFATYIGDYHEQSHGEAFLSLLNDRFRGDGLYLLDEPEAALSPTRQLAALVRIHELVKDNSQFVIATHSPILLAYPGAKIIQFNQFGWQQVEYEQTEHFEVTRYFLNNYQRQIDRLLLDND
jgi:predicted ATPase